MAKAPTPGTVDAPAVQPAGKATSYFEITFCGSTLRMPTAISFKERFAVRAATGLPLGQFWGGETKLDEDSFMILWWLARRYNGEPRLSLDSVMETWPENLSSDDIDFHLVTDDEGSTDDPES